MGWQYYDNWEEKQRDLKYILHKQIINTDMTKLLKSIKEPEEKYLSKSINYSKGHYLHNNNNVELIAELKNKISSNNNNESKDNRNACKLNAGNRTKKKPNRKTKKRVSFTLLKKQNRIK
jgi:hypothetical protein